MPSAPTMSALAPISTGSFRRAWRPSMITPNGRRSQRRCWLVASGVTTSPRSPVATSSASSTRWRRRVNDVSHLAVSVCPHHPAPYRRCGPGPRARPLRPRRPRAGRGNGCRLPATPASHESHRVDEYSEIEDDEVSPFEPGRAQEFGLNCLGVTSPGRVAPIKTRYPSAPNLHRCTHAGGVRLARRFLRPPLVRGPAPGGGHLMQEEDLRATVRALLWDGVLPVRRPDRTWGRPGGDVACSVCALLTATRRSELDVLFGLDVYIVQLFFGVAARGWLECYPRPGLTSPTKQRRRVPRRNRITVDLPDDCRGSRASARTGARQRRRSELRRVAPARRSGDRRTLRDVARRADEGDRRAGAGSAAVQRRRPRVPVGHPATAPSSPTRLRGEHTSAARLPGHAGSTFAGDLSGADQSDQQGPGGSRAHARRAAATASRRLTPDRESSRRPSTVRARRAARVPHKAAPGRPFCPLQPPSGRRMDVQTVGRTSKVLI